jgi:hypothetical protein
VSDDGVLDSQDLIAVIPSARISDLRAYVAVADMQPKSRYRFVLTAFYAASTTVVQYATSFIDILTRSVPVGGSLTVAPSARGTAGITRYGSCRCTGRYTQSETHFPGEPVVAVCVITAVWREFRYTPSV